MKKRIFLLVGACPRSLLRVCRDRGIPAIWRILEHLQHEPVQGAGHGPAFP